MPVNISIPELGKFFQDYRDGIPGDSYNWGPVLTANKVDAIAFHHSVTRQTAKADGNWKKECDLIANLHINSNGWGGVGYRFIIASDGTIAYVGDLAKGGSGVLNHNDHIISICFIGDFSGGLGAEHALPTANQIHSAYLFQKFFREKMPAYPKIDSEDDIKGHRDFMSTTCPSPAWRDPNDSLRNRILRDNWSGYPDPKPVVAPTPTPTPQPTPTPPAPTPTPPSVITDPTAKVRVDGRDLELRQVDALLKDFRDKFVKIRDITNS